MLVFIQKETMMSDAPAMHEVLGADAPSNWVKWGPQDGLGSLNYLGAEEVLRGVQQVCTGEAFTLQVLMGRKESPGDPVWPGRSGIERQNILDERSWDGEEARAFPGGLHYADDNATMFLQGSTQYDALGPVWYDGKIWNGYDARSTVGSLEKDSVLPIAEKGVAGFSTWPGAAASTGWIKARPSPTPISRPPLLRRG